MLMKSSGSLIQVVLANELPLGEWTLVGSDSDLLDHKLSQPVSVVRYWV